MKFPFSWLKELLTFTHSPKKIASTLVSCGIEVEHLEERLPPFEKVVVGRIEKTTPHPQAEKLTIATVWDGDEEWQVVCGAPNCRPGLLTAFAQIGAKLPEADGKSFKIKKTKLRGVESFGMLCSEAELQLSEDHDKIMEFSHHFSPGVDLQTFYSELILEVSLTPNLNHCHSMVGIARELGTSLNIPLKEPIVSIPKTSTHNPQVEISLPNEDECSRYAACLIKGVKIEPSPQWLQKKLHDCGLKTVNNVVDITNYVLMELGHPLHAFDFDKLPSKKINVQSLKGVSFHGLNHQTYHLEKETLCVCDGQIPIAIAGVMGSQETEITHTTTSILLESAYFSPQHVRRASKTLGISSDSSKRFERGSDPNQILKSLGRAIALILEITKGEIVGDVLDIQKKVFLPKKIPLRISRVNAILGTHFSLHEIEDIFQRLHFVINPIEEGKIEVTVPTYRVDIDQEIDLIEEIIRFHGVDNLPKIAPRYKGSVLPHAPIYSFEKQVRHILCQKGLQEFLTCNLISQEMASMTLNPSISEKNLIGLKNPNSIDHSFMRPSLFTGLLQVIKTNQSHQHYHLHGFEIGKIHLKTEDSFSEQSMCAIVLSGNTLPSHWSKKENPVDFYDLKGIIETLLAKSHFKNISFKASSESIFQPGKQASIYVDELQIGICGQVHPQILRKFDLKGSVLFGEINLNDLMGVRPSYARMTPLSIYPGMQRDWTITLDEKTELDSLLKVLKESSSKLLQHIDVVDVYHHHHENKKLKNITLRFFYRNQEKTLSQEEVDSEHKKICQLIPQ